MLWFFIIPFVVLVLRKHSIKGAFTKIDLYPLYLVEIIHIVFQANAYFGNYEYVRYAQVLQYAFTAVLLIPILRRGLHIQAIAGCVSVIIGTLMNNLVIGINQGKMPVYPTLSRLSGFYEEGSLSGEVDSLHILMTGETKLNFLADYIDTGFSILSVGDVFIHAFVSIVIYYTVAEINKGKDKPKTIHKKVRLAEGDSDRNG